MARLGVAILDGEMSGDDPRTMPRADLATLGHVLKPLLAVIRAKCLDCCGGVPSEVRRCVSTTCDLWPYRMRSNPLRDKRVMSDEQRAEVRERFAKARAAGEVTEDEDDEE